MQQILKRKQSFVLSHQKFYSIMLTCIVLFSFVIYFEHRVGSFLYIQKSNIEIILYVDGARRILYSASCMRQVNVLCNKFGSIPSYIYNFCFLSNRIFCNAFTQMISIFQTLPIHDTTMKKNNGNINYYFIKKNYLCIHFCIKL